MASLDRLSGWYSHREPSASCSRRESSETRFFAFDVYLGFLLLVLQNGSATDPQLSYSMTSAPPRPFDHGSSKGIQLDSWRLTSTKLPILNATESDAYVLHSLLPLFYSFELTALSRSATKQRPSPAPPPSARNLLWQQHARPTGLEHRSLLRMERPGCAQGGGEGYGGQGRLRR